MEIKIKPSHVSSTALMVFLITAALLSNTGSMFGGDFEATSNTIVVRVGPTAGFFARTRQVFNITLYIENMTDPGVGGVQFKLTWNSSVLNAVNMTDVLFHSVTPPEEWWNIWEVENVVEPDYAWYAYTWKNRTRALEMGYAPIFGNKILAVITLNVTGLPSGSTTFEFSILDIRDVDANPLPSTTVVCEVKITAKEDIDNNGGVDVFDSIAFGAYVGSRPGDPNWDPLCDLMPDNFIDIFDAYMVARMYGWYYPGIGFIPDAVPWELKINVSGVTYIVTVLSDYIVYSNYSFSPSLKQLNFNVTSSIDAFCNVTIPRGLMSGAFTVYLDDVPTPSIITWDTTHYYIYFTSIQLSHKVKIVGEYALSIPGDANNDGIVDIYDAIILAGNFGKSSAT